MEEELYLQTPSWPVIVRPLPLPFYDKLLFHDRRALLASGAYKQGTCYGQRCYYGDLASVAL